MSGGWIAQQLADGMVGPEMRRLLDEGATCPGCGHSDPSGYEGCGCDRVGCACHPVARRGRQ